MCIEQDVVFLLSMQLLWFKIVSVYIFYSTLILLKIDFLIKYILNMVYLLPTPLISSSSTLLSKSRLFLLLENKQAFKE